MTDEEKLYNLAIGQATTNANLATAQNDINNLGNTTRQDIKELHDKDDEIEAKVNEVKTDLKIYKAMSGLIATIVIILAWIISNMENIKGLIK